MIRSIKLRFLHHQILKMLILKQKMVVAKFTWVDSTITPKENEPTPSKSFSMQANKKYSFYCYR